MESILTLIISGIFTVIVAYFSAKKAIRYLYESRLLERKERAYVELIEAFHEVIDPLQVWHEIAMAQADASHPDDQLYRVKYREGLRKIRKATNVGAFYFPKNVMVVLERLRKNEGKDSAYDEVSAFEYYDGALSSHRIALREIIEIACDETSGALV